MKVIIIEGPDNTGKSFLINHLLSKYKHSLCIHCGKPEIKDPIKAALSQKEYFTNVVDNIVHYNHDYIGKKEFIHTVIFDRSWLGEYVYGCKYRGNGEEFVLEMINELNKKLLNGVESVYYIYLTVDNINFLVRNDDGKSISKANKEAIQDEINRFDEMYNVMEHTPRVRCIKFIVNDGMKYKMASDYFNEIDKFV